MIEVTVMLNDDTDLARLRIYNTSEDREAELGNYRVEYAVTHGESYSVFTRYLTGFPRKKFNALALVKLALDQLTEEEFDLDTEAPADMARRFSSLSAAFTRRKR